MTPAVLWAQMWAKWLHNPCRPKDPKKGGGSKWPQNPYRLGGQVWAKWLH